MGNEVLSSDDAVANAFADGLAIACSYDQSDAPILDAAMIPGATVALSKLTEAIRKYGNGETIDVARVSKLTKSAGTCLAATTATTLGTPDISDLGGARLRCIDSLFLLLGSPAFRKDEEIALWAGEALAQYADAYSPKDVEWSTEQDIWPTDYNEEFSKRLPPHQQVIYTLLRRAKYESNPQKRTASSPALFAVVARAAKQVSKLQSIPSIMLLNYLLTAVIIGQPPFESGRSLFSEGAMQTSRGYSAMFYQSLGGS